ncbi:Card1-like endonuclease domain-containing protein [Clostridium paraputrificum]|uniref:Card1-like endonuclease domain-containing protein n=1 Tax=Clostridium paraputrificum TaxID=29363 RepID=UPI003D325B2A
MGFSLIISQFDEHNEVTIMLAKKFNVINIVMLVQKEDLPKIRELKKIEDTLYIEEVILEPGDSDCIKDTIDSKKDRDILINLTGGERINSLILLKIAIELKLQSIYVDLLNKKRYILGENFRVIKEQLEDMTIEDITKLAGANIVDDSSYLCSKKEIVDLTKEILRHLELWHKYKQRLYDNNTFKHDYKDTSKVIINKYLLSKEELTIVSNTLKYLKETGGLEYYNKGSEIFVTFKNNYLKGFLFKSGTWLEVLTNVVINEIKEVDEVKSSVIFLWSEGAKRVRNELDVIAVKDSVLLCISCKDSDKYDENALNELEVYSNRLGGPKAIKILVATKQPIKVSVIDRAKEMGINLVIVDKNIDAFKKKLTSIIKK